MPILVSSINWLFAIFSLPYVAAMLIYPFFKGDWAHVHSVWYTWQSLNTGVLAFFASVVALNAVKYSEKQKRHRNFIAARAFLPKALSELSSYFDKCALVLNEAWVRSKGGSHNCKTPLSYPLPESPEKYQQVFKECISEAEPAVGKQLAYVLVRLQVHQSRIESMYSAFSSESNEIQIHLNIMSYIFCLAELQGLVNQLFGFSRGDAPFDDSPLKIESFFGSYLAWDIDIETNEDLKAFTERNYSKHWTNT